MTDDTRHISDADADAIADALTGKTAAGRLERGKQSMNGLLRTGTRSLRDRTNARVLGRINQPAPAEGGES